MENKNTRLAYSKEFKRNVLLDITCGVCPKEAFLRQAEIYNINIDSQDKKYISKIVCKWKKELYLNKNVLFLDYKKASLTDIDNEIYNVGLDDECFIFNSL